jgi:hypothetical protein
MRRVRYTAIVVSFLVGWIGVAVLVRHWMAELLPGDYGDMSGERQVLTDWLELPGCVLGLPVGWFLAYVMSAVPKRKRAR